MIKKLSFLIIGILVFSVGCKKEFLQRFPLDTPVDDSYWVSEDNVRTFAYGFYPAYFEGYSSGFDLAWGGFSYGQTLTDDVAPSTPTAFTRVVPTSGGGWTFTWVRKANLFINRVQRVNMSDEAKRHWTGVGRLFRALEYNDLVKRFGDVPWYGHEIIDPEDPELYKPRDSRILVMDSVLQDFKYAAENVRANDGTNQLTVTRNVVLALMSRVFLFQGTFLKYHNINQQKATEYLQASQWAANEVMMSGKYSIGDPYRSVFNSVDLAGKKEIILYRRYEATILTHSLHSYVNLEAQTGASKDAVESFLSKDGLPIMVSPLYKGDKTIINVTTDRDARLTEIFARELRIRGVHSNYSTSGYVAIKFFNEAIKDVPDGLSQTNTTDAPEIRFGEVLLNYAEATAELGNLTQADLDKSINLLRARPGINMPKLQVIGGQPAVNGVVYDDPKRDPTVPSLIWEIRRERRVELMFEGFRYDDLRRWKKLEYLDTEVKKDINRGAWIRKVDFPAATVTLEGSTTEGYIIPAPSAATARRFDPATGLKYYMEPLPLDQITIYTNKGYVLTQNPGW